MELPCTTAAAAAAAAAFDVAFAVAVAVAIGGGGGDKDVAGVQVRVDEVVDEYHLEERLGEGDPDCAVGTQFGGGTDISRSRSVRVVVGRKVDRRRGGTPATATTSGGRLGCAAVLVCVSLSMPPLLPLLPQCVSV